MKFLLAFALTLTSLSCFAEFYSCQAINSEYEEYALEINTDTSEAYYFNNDTSYHVPCHVSGKSQAICEKENIFIQFNFPSATVQEEQYDGIVETAFLCQ